MKKMLSILLALTLFVLPIFPVSAQETTRLGYLEILQTLDANRAVDGFWIPILPEGYEIDDVTVEQDGSYYYDIHTVTASDITIIKMAVVKSTNTHIPNSPYQSMLAQKGVENSDALSDEILNTLSDEDYIRYEKDADHSTTYVFRGTPGVDTYGDFKATYIGWDVQGRNYGDIGLDTGYEMVIQLDDATLLSFVFKTSATADTLNQVGGIMNYMKMQLPLDFVRSGDVDGNGAVNAVDALAMLKHGVDKEPITDEMAVLLADCDNNNIINAADALYALRVAVGK